MPTYEIDAPDGKTYEIDGPAGASKDQIIAAIIAKNPQAGLPPSKERTFGEAAKDIAASGLSGIGSLVKAPGQLYGLATGNMEKTGSLGLGEDIEKYGEAMKSAGLKAREAERDKKIAEAEKKGQFAAFGTALGETIKDPGLLVSFLAQQAPQLLIPFGAGRVGAGIAKGLGAAEAAAGAAGTASAVGAGAVQQGADVGAGAYEDIYNELKSKGATEKAAAEGAINLARAAGASGAIISLLSQKLPGAQTFEKYAAKVPGSGGRVAGAIKGGLGEAGQEITEETGGKFSQNLAMREVNPEQSLTAGLGQTAGMAALGGLGMGVVGGAGRPQTPQEQAPPETTPLTTAEQAPPGETPPETPPQTTPDLKGNEIYPKGLNQLQAMVGGTNQANQNFLDLVRQRKAKEEEKITKEKEKIDRMADEAMDPVLKASLANASKEKAKQLEEHNRKSEMELFLDLPPEEKTKLIEAGNLDAQTTKRKKDFESGGFKKGWTAEEEAAMGIEPEVKETVEKAPPLDRSTNPSNIGINGEPIVEGGKLFASEEEARSVRKKSRLADYVVTKMGEGWALSPKTKEDLERDKKNAERLANNVGLKPGDVMGAGQLVALYGGLHPVEKADMGVEDNQNITHGNKKVFTLGGMSIEKATEMLLERGFISEDNHDKAREAIKANTKSYEGEDKSAEKTFAEKNKEGFLENAGQELYAEESEEMAYPVYQNDEQEATALLKGLQDQGVNTDFAEAEAERESQNQPNDVYYKNLVPKLRDMVKGETLQAKAGQDHYTTTAEQKKNAQELEGKNINQVGQWLVDNAPNKAAKYIANKVLNRIKAMQSRGIKINFMVHTGEKRTIKLANANGFTNFIFGKNNEESIITVGLNGPTTLDKQTNFPPGTDYTTVFHELLHVAIRPSTRFYGKNDPLVNELRKLYNIVAKHHNQNVKNGTHEGISKRYHNGQNNAFLDPDELISWGLTDKEMQEYLSKIKVGDSNVFSQLVKWVREALGISPKYESALDRLIRTTESILDESIEKVSESATLHGYTFGSLKAAKPTTELKQQSLFSKKVREMMGEDFKSVNLNQETTKNDYPIIKGDKVSGLDIRESVPNQGSISSSLDDYTVLPGIREVQVSDFEAQGKPKYYSTSEEKRTLELAEQIKNNKEISPLIVVIDSKGPYILEGGHRFDALRELGIKSFPAMVVIDNERESETLQAMNLNQAVGKVKGAIHRSQQRKVLPEGAFKGVNPSVVNAIQSVFYAPNKTIVDRIDGLKNDFWARLAQKTVDQFRSIKDISPIGYMMARLSQSVDGALEGLLFYGKVINDDGALNIQKGTKGMYDILKPLGIEVDRFQVWMALNREQNLPAEKRSPNLDSLRATKDDLNAGTMDNGQNRNAVYEKARKELMDLNRSVLDVAKSKGLIDDEAYDRFANDAFYIPFYREMEDGKVESIQSSSTLTNKHFSEALKGNNEKAFGDLMENTLRNWSHILSASMKNGAAVQTMKDAEREMFVSKVTPSHKGTDVVKVMEDGKQQLYRVHDPFLLESISNITFLGKPNAFLDVAKDFRNILRFGVTISPAFKVSNLFKDSISAMAVSGLEKTPWSNVVGTWAQTKRGSPAYIEALAGGGIFNFGTSLEGDQAALIKKLIARGVDPKTILSSPEGIKDGLKTLYKAYEDLGNRTEAVNRLALYKQLRAKGLNHLEASFQARDLLDFSMQGSSGAFRYLTQTVPFMNARLQGLYKLGRDGIIPTSRVIYNSVTGKPIEADDAKKAQAFTLVTVSTMLASMALYLAFKDDDDFKKREQWDRDNFWWIKLPGMDSALRIPKPFEIGAFGTIAERVLEQIVDQEAEGKQFGDSMSNMLWNTFSMNPIPQWAKPLVDIYANKDSFTGAPIETAGMEKLSKAERMTDTTSPLAIALGGIMNTVLPESKELSPVQTDYMIKSYFGWLGGTAAAASHYAVMPFKEGSYPDANWQDRISLGFVKSLPSTQSTYVTSFYENNKAIQQAYADMRHYAEIGDYDKVIQIQEEKGDQIMLEKVYDKTSKEIANVRKQIRVITNDESMDGTSKKEEIDRLKELISMLAEQAESLRKSMK